MPTRRVVLAGSIGVIAALPPLPSLAAAGAPAADFAAACRRTEAAWRRLLAIEERMTADGLPFVRDADYRAHDRLQRGSYRSCRSLGRRSREPEAKEWTDMWRDRRQWAFEAIRRNSRLWARFGERSAEWGLGEAQADVRRCVARERSAARARTEGPIAFDPPLASRSFHVTGAHGDGYACIHGALFEDGGAAERDAPDEFAAATYVRRMEELGYRLDRSDSVHALTADALADPHGDAARLNLRAARAPGFAATVDAFILDRPERYVVFGGRRILPETAWRIVRHLEDAA